MAFPFTQTLPPIGSFETTTLDFKTYSPDLVKKRFELAKDAAAFANVAGGTLLIGADAVNGELKGYRGVRSEPDVQELVRAYEESVRDRCVPAPTISSDVLSAPAGGLVVAIHVAPSIGPVAVKIKGSKDDGFAGDAWAFFTRIASQNKPVRPEELAMIMTPDVRRIAILLRSIPADADVQLKYVHNRNGHRMYTGGSRYRVLDVDELTNTAVFTTERNRADRTHIAIDTIETVFQRPEGVWAVYSVPYDD